MPAEREKGQLAAGGAGRKICAHRHHLPRALLRAARRHRGSGQRVRACGYARPTASRGRGDLVANFGEKGSGLLGIT
eukprot:scaffold14836_cov31-Phaeocystis_antarctica.AAC.1